MIEYDAIPMFLEIPSSPENFIFIAAVFFGTLAILFDIYPEVVMGVGLLVWIIYLVDMLGPNPMLFAMFLILAAIVRILGMGGRELYDRLDDIGNGIWTGIAFLLGIILGRR